MDDVHTFAAIKRCGAFHVVLPDLGSFFSTVDRWYTVHS